MHITQKCRFHKSWNIADECEPRVQELEELGLVETRKKGRSSMVCTNYDTRTLYNKASPYLRDPVQKRLYVKTESWLDALPRAGEEAAVLLGAAYSKKNCPVRAIEKRIFWNSQIGLLW